MCDGRQDAKGKRLKASSEKPVASSGLLTLHRQLPFFWCHLFPQHFEIALHARIARVPVERFGEPAIGAGKVAANAVPGRVHGAEQGLGFGIGGARGDLQIALRPGAVFRNSSSVEVFLSVGHQPVLKGGSRSCRRRFGTHCFRHGNGGCDLRLLPCCLGCLGCGRLRRAYLLRTCLRRARLWRGSRRRFGCGLRNGCTVIGLWSLIRRPCRRRGRSRSTARRRVDGRSLGRFDGRRLYVGRRRIRRRLDGHNRGRCYGGIWSRGRDWSCRNTTGHWLLDQSSPGISITLPMPCQQAPAHDQQEESQIESSMAAAWRLIFKQVIQITGAFVSQPQKRGAAYRLPGSFPRNIVSERRQGRSQRGPTDAAETVLGVIFLAALKTTHCHGSRHHYTNSDANLARPFGMHTL